MERRFPSPAVLMYSSKHPAPTFVYVTKTSLLKVNRINPGWHCHQSVKPFLCDIPAWQVVDWISEFQPADFQCITWQDVKVYPVTSNDLFAASYSWLANSQLQNQRATCNVHSLEKQCSALQVWSAGAAMQVCIVFLLKSSARLQ